MPEKYHRRDAGADPLPVEIPGVATGLTDLFDTVVHEVEHDGKRFILRRNEAIQSR